MQKKALNVAVGERIRNMREYQRMTREQVAERANISTQFLADIEHGYKSMTAPTIIGLAKALGVSTDYLLLGWDNDAQFDSDKLRAILTALPENKRSLVEELLLLFLRGIRS